MKFRSAAAGVLAALFSALTATAVSAEPVNIRIQWSVTPAHMTPLIPLAPEGIYKHYGKSYTVEPIRMRGSGPALQALAAGEIDFGGMSIQALTLGVKRARLDLQVIAQVMSSGVEGWATSEFYVRDDSPIRTFKDMKGKIAAGRSTLRSEPWRRART
jgi:sulfonate transport system substrate-binding protein